MRKFSLLSLLVFFSLLTACEVNVEAPEEGKVSDPTSVGFGVYMKRGVTTKAGYAGELTAEKLRTVANGFGVFSYYGNGALYNETSKPDFMYNQQVTFTTNGVWEYSPIKYWPNEYGAEAGSESADRLTFFAYAPYVAVTPSTGIVTAADNTDGILGMTRNIAAGDPMVMYGACLQPGGGVDLCWGVSADNFTSSVDGNKNNVQSGDPFIDVIKPKTGDRLTFEFNHALSQLNVQIDTDVDVESHATSSLAPETRIYVRSVSFTGFTTRGSLNLNSKRGNPAWFDISGTGRLRRDPVTIYDGRSDGLEGVSTAADVNETPATLSPKIIQSSPFDAQNRDGVTNTPVNLFSFADPVNSVADVNAPIMVIPIVGVPVTVTIVYDVETADPNLASFLSDGETRGVSTENKITKTVQMDGKNMTLEPGKRYVIGLHLGLTSVKFAAEVAPWDDTEYKGKADLPENVPGLGSISITDPTSGADRADTTVWRNVSSLAAPTVKVTAPDGTTDITSSVTLTWKSSAEDVATVQNDGAVSLTGKAGEARISVLAEKDDKTASKSYWVYVNEVTGISSITTDPASAKTASGSTIVLEAILEYTAFGNITTWPTVAWVSGTPAAFTVSPGSSEATNGVATATASAVADGTSTITATVDEAFTSSPVSLTKELTCEPATVVHSFRGYQISKGVLKRDAERKYSLTSGTDPLETILDFYGNAASIDVYYHLWGNLRDELGSDGANISQTGANCIEFPTGWMLPSETDWSTIIKGASSGIVVNGTAVTRAGYAFAQVAVDASKTVYGLLLIPDKTSISCEHINVATVGLFISDYSVNPLTLSDLSGLTDNGCIFVPSAGFVDSGSFQYGDYSVPGYYPDGFYLTSTSETFLEFIYRGISFAQDDIGHRKMPVRLVKKL